MTLHCPHVDFGRVQRISKSHPPIGERPILTQSSLTISAISTSCEQTCFGLLFVHLLRTFAMRKDQITKTRNIRFEGIDYTIELCGNTQLVFFATGGATKKGRIEIDSWYFGQDTEEFGDVGLIRNPFQLSRMIHNIVVELIYEFLAASLISFKASTDRKKGPYRRFAKQLAAQLSVWYDYEPTDSGGHQYIRRKQKLIKS